MAAIIATIPAGTIITTASSPSRRGSEGQRPPQRCHNLLFHAVALIGSVGLSISLLFAVAAPVLAGGAPVSGPACWTPGTIYKDVGGANPNNVMPTSRPTDNAVNPPAPAVSWTNNGWGFGSATCSDGSGGGQYCTDASGGSVWVPEGAPADQLTC